MNDLFVSIHPLFDFSCISVWYVYCKLLSLSEPQQHLDTNLYTNSNTNTAIMSGTNNFPGGSTQNFSEQALDNFFNGPISDFSNLTPEDEMTFNTDATVSPINLSLNADFSQQNFAGPMLPEQLPPMQMPTQAPQMTDLGPSYDPRIGWYYPAQAPKSYPPPPPPTSAPYQALSVNEGYIPIAPPVQMMHPTQPQMVSQNGYYPKQSNKRKEYFGPAAHEPSKRQKRKAVDDFSSDEDEPPRQTTRKVKNPKTRKAPKDPKSTKLPVDGVRQRGKPPSIEMACVCTTGYKKTTAIKRPKNAFIIFRMQQQKNISRELWSDPSKRRNKAGGVSHDVISIEAGARWKAMTREEKEPFYDMAAAEAKKHRELYPDYRYVPGAKGRSPHFGTSSCGCGAYQKNLAKLRREGGSPNTSDDAAESELEEVEAYVPPRSRPAYQAPAAQMYAPTQQFPKAMPDFGFSTPAQQAEAAKAFAALTAKRTAAAAFPADNDAPTRRSARSHAQVSYTEPADNVDEEQEDTFEAELTAQLSEALNAPSPTMEGKTKRRPSAIFTPLNSPPALNTRSRSKGSLDLPTVPEDQILSTEDYEDLFGGGEFNMDEYVRQFTGDDESVTVTSRAASRRNSTRKASPKGHAASPQGVDKRRGSSARSTRATRRSPRHSPRH
ncbi:MAG: HMG-box domain-containing protein [Janthinobacterium lividum]